MDGLSLAYKVKSIIAGLVIPFSVCQMFHTPFFVIKVIWFIYIPVSVLKLSSEQAIPHKWVVCCLLTASYPEPLPIFT